MTHNYSLIFIRIYIKIKILLFLKIEIKSLIYKSEKIKTKYEKIFRNSEKSKKS